MPAIPAVGSILNHPALPTIFEDETMKVTCIDGTGEHCLVTFVGVGHGQDGVDQQSEEFRKAVGGRGPRLFVFDKSRSWGNSLDIDLLADVTAPYRKARSVATMGLSMGGFLAVQMSTVLGATRCVALAPQYSIHPTIAHLTTGGSATPTQFQFGSSLPSKAASPQTASITSSFQTSLLSVSMQNCFPATPTSANSSLNLRNTTSLAPSKNKDDFIHFWRPCCAEQVIRTCPISAVQMITAGQ
jgi:hypothetical protein